MHTHCTLGRSENNSVLCLVEEGPLFLPSLPPILPQECWNHKCTPTSTCYAGCGKWPQVTRLEWLVLLPTGTYPWPRSVICIQNLIFFLCVCVFMEWVLFQDIWYHWYPEIVLIKLYLSHGVEPVISWLELGIENPGMQIEKTPRKEYEGT